jgi:hypothetical protein
MSTRLSSPSIVNVSMKVIRWDCALRMSAGDGDQDSVRTRCNSSLVGRSARIGSKKSGRLSREGLVKLK